MTVTLSLLKLTRQSKGVEPRHLSAVTGLPVPRIRELEAATRPVEPWLDEAYMLMRALCTDGILPLISSGSLTDLDLDFSINDREALRSGVRMPLTMACRLAVEFGLTDPYDLVVRPHQQQIWSIIHDNERGAEPGCCPWCLADIYAGEHHHEMCLPDNLWAARNVMSAEALTVQPRPKGRESKRGASAIAKGLKSIRLRLGRTQEQMASAIGVDKNHFARMERGEVRMTLINAERFASVFHVEVPEIFAEPEEHTLDA